MRRVILTARFEKDVKRLKKRNYDTFKLLEVMSRLAAGETLEERYRDHFLKGEYFGTRECHLAPDLTSIIPCYNDGRNSEIPPLRGVIW